MKKYIILLIYIILLLSCSNYKEKKEAREAEKLEQEKIITELNMLEPINRIIIDVLSKIEIGINYIEYSEIVRKLKSEIDYTKSKVSTEEAINMINKYKEICDILIDAYQLWDFEIEHSRMHEANSAILLKTVSFKGNRDNAQEKDIWNKYLYALIEKYKLEIIEDEDYIEATGYTIINYYLYSEYAIQTIWEEAEAIKLQISN